MLKKLRIVAAETEATSGTAETLVAADAAFNAFNPMFQLNKTMHARDNPAGFGSLSDVPGAQFAVLTFTTEVHGDGAGGVPFWASELLPACGWVNSSGTFSPTTEAPGSNVKTLTMAVYQDGLIKKMSGAAGTAQLVFEAGKHVMINWTFTGKFESITDGAILSGVSRPTNKPIVMAGQNISIGGATAACIQNIAVDLGNNVVARPCANEAGAVEAGLITGRNVTATLDPESVLVATNNTFGKWLAGTEEAFSLVLDDGTDAITFAGPKFQRTNIQEGDRDGIVTDDTTARFNISSGDDEFTIDFAASA